MEPIIYLNGQWVKESEAKISIFDRGVLMSDSIYEATAVINGQLLDYEAHMLRFLSSIKKLNMNYSINLQELLQIHLQLKEKNNLKEGLIYLQLSRGSGPRDFNYENHPYKPHLFLFTIPLYFDKPIQEIKSQHLISKLDGRWQRRDIKTTQLLYASQAKTEAVQQGADDVIFTLEGNVTESSSSNISIITKQGTLITHPTNEAILPGITRARLLKIAHECGIPVLEKPFTLDEALNAAEVFVSSASQIASPVSMIDGVTIADYDNGWGPITQKLRKIYFETVPKT
ncbi:aminotransferase class IV [Bartonella sp. DGB1]|uniref:aminotransferase class IV n=1 Tax=Bartonella sp. DGB1 TaxID=3239807 RepID=UPI003526B6CA